MGQQERRRLTQAERDEQKRKELNETDSGTYFALSHRQKRVCIDTGLQHLLEQFINEPWIPQVQATINHLLATYLQDYSKVWFKDPQGQFQDVERITCDMVRMNPEGMRFAPRQFAENVLTLSPHYKVPNDQSMGSPPLHFN
jgi:hypothetical protein